MTFGSNCQSAQTKCALKFRKNGSGNKATTLAHLQQTAKPTPQKQEAPELRTRCRQRMLLRVMGSFRNSILHRFMWSPGSLAPHSIWLLNTARFATAIGSETKRKHAADETTASTVFKVATCLETRFSAPQSARYSSTRSEICNPSSEANLLRALFRGRLRSF